MRHLSQLRTPRQNTIKSGWLQQQRRFSHSISSGHWTSKTRVPARLHSGKSPLPGIQTASFLLSSQAKLKSPPLLIRILTLPQGLPCYLNVITAHRPQPPNIIRPGSRASTYEFGVGLGGHKHSVHTWGRHILSFTRQFYCLCERSKLRSHKKTSKLPLFRVLVGLKCIPDPACGKWHPVKYVFP